MNYFEQIDLYTSGEMNAAEQAAFEAALQTDTALKTAYEEWLATDAIVQKHQQADAGAALLKETLAPLTKTYFSAQPKAKIVPFKRIVIGAIAVAAILLIIFTLPGTGIDSYSITPMPNAIVRGQEDAAQQGAQLFNEGKYAAALPNLQKNAAANPSDATANYYYAVCMVKTEAYASALPVLKQLAEGTSAYKDDAAFFAALSAYELKDPATAGTYAKKVPETNQYYKNALQILKKVQ